MIWQMMIAEVRDTPVGILCVLLGVIIVLYSAGKFSPRPVTTFAAKLLRIALNEFTIRRRRKTFLERIDALTIVIFAILSVVFLLIEEGVLFAGVPSTPQPETAPMPLLTIVTVLFLFLSCLLSPTLVHVLKRQTRVDRLARQAVHLQGPRPDKPLVATSEMTMPVGNPLLPVTVRERLNRARPGLLGAWWFKSVSVGISLFLVSFVVQNVIWPSPPLRIPALIGTIGATVMILLNPVKRYMRWFAIVLQVFVSLNALPAFRSVVNTSGSGQGSFIHSLFMSLVLEGTPWHTNLCFVAILLALLLLDFFERGRHR